MMIFNESSSANMTKAYTEKTPLVQKESDRRKPFTTSRTYIRAMGYIGFMVTCLEKLVSGSIMASPAYLNDLKSTYNYTQSEVEIISSAIVIGQGLTVFPGMFFDRFGAKLSNGVGVVLTAGGFALIWSTSRAIVYYHSRALLLALYFFIGGFGSTFAYVTSQATSIVNLDPRWRGKVLGIEDALMGGSNVVFSQIYFFGFKLPDTSSTSAIQHDFPGFILLVGICFVVVDLLCLVFCDYYTADDSSCSEENVEFQVDNQRDQGQTSAVSLETVFLQQNRDKTEVPTQKGASCIHDMNAAITFLRRSPEMTKNLPPKHSRDHIEYNIHDIVPLMDHDDLPFLQILRHPNYIICLWTFVVLCVVDFVSYTNLTAASKSLGLSQYDIYLVPLLALSCLLTSFSMGFILDKVKTNRWRFLILAALSAIIGQIFYIAFGDSAIMFFIASFLTGITCGILWVSIPTEVSERFGTRHFGRNWGFIRAMQTVMNFIAHYIFGVLYEINTKGGDLYCYGLDCIRYGYIFLLALGVLSLSIILFLCRKVREL